MIQIEKGAAPDAIKGKCAEVSQELKDIFAQLQAEYTRQDTERKRLGSNTPIAFGAAEKARVVTALVGGRRVTKKEKDRLTAKLGLVKFGEELVEVMNPVLADDSVLLGLQSEWASRFPKYAGEYHAVAAKARETWDGKLTGMSGESRAGLLGLIRPLFQAQVLATGRPWLSAPPPSALDMPWFTPLEVAGWTFPEALKDASLELKTGAVAAHQAQLHAFRELCRGTESLRKYVPLAWMCGTPDSIPAERDLWAFAFGFHSGHLKKGKHSPLNMGDADLKAMATAPEAQRNTLAYHALGVRILGDLLDEKLAAGWKTVTRPLIGFKSEIFSSDHYSGHGIKEALLNCHHGKCAFCEAKVKFIAHGDVEHFRPKAGYEQGHGFNLDGYFWEAYAWDNLYYSCQVCNQVYKGNKFPVLLNDQAVEVRSTMNRKAAEESPILIDPAFEDPRLAIRFNVWTGEAYAYDLLRWYLRTFKSVTTADEFAWSKPRELPSSDGKFEVKVDLTTKQFQVIGTGHEMFLETHRAPPLALRGVRTLQLLGLNRTELVLQRVSHLRHLRGLFWAGLVEQSESAAARAALEDAMKPAAEFSSLARDAWETWTREVVRVKAQVSQQEVNPFNVGITVDPWIAQYNTLLRKEPVYEDVPGTNWEASTSVMYHVQPSQLGTAKRGLVYIKADEELTTTAGWYVCVPEEDYSLEAVFLDEDDEELERLTLGALLKLAQPWRKFSKATSVVVEGPFRQALGF